MSDLVIRGGTVIDGTGAPGARADVAIEAGRIAAVGEGLRGDRELDATDHVVAPGFIDIHTHYDAQVFWDPALTPSCFHGVTTVVAGNCGFSIAPTRTEHREVIVRTLEQVEDMDVVALTAGIPWDFHTFPEYLDSVGRHGLGLNFAAYIGHTALRLYVMGDEAYERTATAQEIETMHPRRPRGRRHRICHQFGADPSRRRRQARPQPVCGPDRIRRSLRSTA
jgi:N-acyl-D-amino-acid deacylase